MITLQEVKQEVRELLEANPDTVNPRERPDGGACVYDNGRGRRCVVGQWAFNRSILPYTEDGDVDGEGSPASEVPFNGDLDEAVLEWLDEIQSIADGDTVLYGPTTWGQVLDRAEELGFL